jgi:ComF family protein
MFCPDCDVTAGGLIAAPRCRRCAMPAVRHGAPCPHCRNRGLPPYRRVVAVGKLEGPLRSAVHRAKYGRQWTVAEALADLIADANGTGVFDGIDALVPVPLHPRRHRERGFNQADVIARRLGRRVGIPVLDVVDRITDTTTQATIHARAGRMANLRHAFAVTRPAVIRGKHVMVIDDVLTTGATLVSIARALKSAAPAALSAAVACVADPRGRSFEFV